jgi:serine/threonine protein kinase/Tol biopolymer transport system component
LEPERWRHIERLYHAALDLEETGRAAFLDGTCGGDDDLRQEVEAMLASDARAGSFLESAAMPAAARMLASERRAAPPKSTVAHYRIVEKLGVGGMGIVYKAQDTRLGRFVALKFLPESIAHDRLALERFKREARVASSLDHPNIRMIYEVGDDEGRPFIAMQCLEGETLKKRIESKALSKDELFDFAVQIADALDAAHAKGVIHRDIKPANIFITRRGEVNILDFGLAKVCEGSADLTDLTGSGISMGTAAYMSPEQARGQELDVRSDLFSFGAVLHEMATRHEAFPGRTAAVIHDAILNREPLRPSRLNQELPAGFDAIVLKALEKDREFRYQSAAEIRADLKRLRRDSSSGRLVAMASPPTGDPREASPRSGKQYRRLAGMAAIAALPAIGWFAWVSVTRPLPMLERQLTSSFGTMVSEAAISPDGRSLAYGDNEGLSVKIIDTGEVHPLAWPSGVRIFQIAWFPNNQDLLISAMPGTGIRTQLWITSVFGGSPKPLRDDVRDFAISWDGSRVAFVPNAMDSIWVMNRDGENARKLCTAPEGYSFDFPAWHSGDKAIVYSSISKGSQTNTFESVVVETGRPGSFRTTGKLGWEIVPLHDGRMLSLGPESSADSLYEIKAGLASWRAVNSARSLRHWPETYVYRPTVSADGKRMAFLKRVSEQAVFIGDIEDGGKRLENVRRLVLSGTSNRVRGWTPDGKAVLFERDRRGSYEVALQPLDRVIPEPLLASQEPTIRERLSPDGKWLIYLLRKQNGEGSLMRMPASGGLPQVLWKNPRLENFYCTGLPANSCVVSVRDQNRSVFYALNPDEDPPSGQFREGQLREVGRSDYGPTGWALSPDGSQIAMVKSEPDRACIHVVPLPDRSGHARSPYDVVVKGWTDLSLVNWAHAGNGWYVSNDMVRSTGFFFYVDLAGNATVLNSPASFVPTWGVPSPDGRRLAFSSFPGITNAWLVENF